MIRKSKTPYVRDVYLAYLIANARRTKKDDYPIIEEWIVATEPPKEMIQWDRRNDVVNPDETGICFYCCDPGFQPILGNPKKYADKLGKYMCIIGMDASPFDNMPLWVQKSQIGLNLGITYYYGSLGMKVIPNVRLGDNRTLSSLEAYPRHTLIAIGTHGFTRKLDNRYIFAEQVQRIIDELDPSGICVYGPVSHEIFGMAILKGIPIYQYDSYTMKENNKYRLKVSLKEAENEG
ncbi:MAG: DUF4417 domain-containing protein [Methanobrevibacter sp.]|nr:DUF4417 domain-containing protein [Methanobrevibacter sp.]